MMRPQRYAIALSLIALNSTALIRGPVLRGDESDTVPCSPKREPKARRDPTNRLVRVAGVLLACSLSLLLIGQAVASAAPAGYTLFTSKPDHYRIYYPSSWIAKRNGNKQYFSGQPCHSLCTTVYIYSGPAPSFMTLVGFGDLEVQGLRRAGATVTGRSRTRVGRYAAWLITGRFSKKISGRMVNDRFATAGFLGRGLAWQSTYSTDPSAFGKDYSRFTTMLSTFAFTS